MRVLILAVFCLLGNVLSQTPVPQQAPLQAPQQAPVQAPQQVPVSAPQQVPVQAPQQAPQQVPAPEQLNEATYLNNYPTPTGLTTGVNPLAFCMVSKLERWVVFWGYFSDQTTTIQNGTNNQYIVTYTTNNQGGQQSYTNVSIPYQPTDFQQGTYYFTTKLAIPYFLAPRGKNGFGYPYYSAQWQLDNFLLTVLAPQQGVTSYECPSTAAFYIVRGGITNATASAASIHSLAIDYLQSILSNVTSNRIVVTPHTTNFGSDVYNFTVVANEVSAYLSSNYNSTLLAQKWANYQPSNVWPPEFEPPRGWELIFYLINNLNVSTWESYPTSYTGNTAPVLYTYRSAPRSPANNPNGNNGQATAQSTSGNNGLSGASSGNPSGTSGTSGGNGSSNVLASITLITLGVLALVVIF